MPKCKICGKRLSNPKSLSHINSQYHQNALRKIEAGESDQHFKPSFTISGFSINKKLLGILILILVIPISILIIFIGFPLWYAGISLNQQLYANKGGGLNYWDFFILNGWSNNFFFNKTALIGAFLGAFIMSIPPTAKLTIKKRDFQLNNL